MKTNITNEVYCLYEFLNKQYFGYIDQYSYNHPNLTIQKIVIVDKDYVYSYNNLNFVRTKNYAILAFDPNNENFILYENDSSYPSYPNDFYTICFFSPLEFRLNSNLEIKYIQSNNGTIDLSSIIDQLNQKADVNHNHTFIQLLDTPNNYQQNKFLKSTNSNIEYSDINFVNLIDTPNSYTNQANKFLKVNSTEDQLVFSDINFIDLIDTPNNYQQNKFLKSTNSNIEYSDINFIDLIDTPNSYLNKRLNFLMINSNENGIDFYSYDTFYVFPYSRIFISSPPANPQLYDCYIDTNHKMYYYVNNQWIEYNWINYIINTKEYQNGYLFISNNKLYFKTSSNINYLCYPLVGSKIFYIQNPNVLYYLPIGSICILNNHNTIPIAINDVLNFDYEISFKLFVNSSTLPVNGYGLLVSNMIPTNDYYYYVYNFQRYRYYNYNTGNYAFVGDRNVNQSYVRTKAIPITTHYRFSITTNNRYLNMLNMRFIKDNTSQFLFELLTLSKYRSLTTTNYTIECDLNFIGVPTNTVSQYYYQIGTFCIHTITEYAFGGAPPQYYYIYSPTLPLISELYYTNCIVKRLN